MMYDLVPVAIRTPRVIGISSSVRSVALDNHLDAPHVHQGGMLRNLPVGMGTQHVAQEHGHMYTAATEVEGSEQRIPVQGDDDTTAPLHNYGPRYHTRQ